MLSRIHTGRCGFLSNNKPLRLRVEARQAAVGEASFLNCSMFTWTRTCDLDMTCQQPVCLSCYLYFFIMGYEFDCSPQDVCTRAGSCSTAAKTKVNPQNTSMQNTHTLTCEAIKTIVVPVACEAYERVCLTKLPDLTCLGFIEKKKEREGFLRGRTPLQRIISWISVRLLTCC